MTSLKSLETFLPTELLKELEALAVEEGRDVEAVVAAAVRRYLWDSTFRTLRRHAQARSRVQGWVSDQSILTTVLALRRPDEFTLTKPETNLGDGVAGDGEAGDVEASAATGSSPRTREPRDSAGRRERRDRREPREPRDSPRNFREPREPREMREPRERMPEMETRRFERSAPILEADADVAREGREERGGRRPRRRTRGGRREDAASVRASSSPDALEPEMTPESPRLPSPSYAVSTPNVDLAAIRRRAESVHRFLPPDPSERENHEETSERPESPANRGSRASVAVADADGPSAPAVERSDSPSESDDFRSRPSRSRSWSRPSPQSSVSASDSPASQPDSPAVSLPEPSSAPMQTPASFGRKPKRSTGRR